MLNDLTAIQLNRYMVLISQAMMIIATFPGVTIVASETQEWTYDLKSLDHNFDRSGVGIDQLIIQASNMIQELQSAYGPDGDGMWDGFLPTRAEVE